MAKQYKVTAPCVVNVPVSSADGAQLNTFYRDAVLPEGVPADRIKHLLDSNLIAPVDGRVEAESVDQEQLSVNSRSSKAELVEYGVAQGGNRAELEAATRDELLDRYVRS
ncbi:hypothetical protein [Nonomuraea indica]|uniref:hypothetical protein n=1 Tax=Nonomuraea indica TaxID=1581193 RepID=UPI000C7DC28F|nr:hypothetical protein [Nonomuraea indica]